VATGGDRWKKPRMNEFEGFGERVVYRERLQGAIRDFRGRNCSQRYDCCEFVKTTILID
jgi:hypothetical protein